MNRFAFVPTITVLLCLVVASCGGRTNRFESDYGPTGGHYALSFDGGVTPGSGGYGGAGYGGGVGGKGYGGYAGYGGYYPGYGGYAGYGGYYPGYGGYAGYGGYYPGYGGYAGYGGYYPGYGGSPVGCSYPACNCNDCVSDCTCYGNDYTYCYSSCYGAGGASYGGYAGYGGYPDCSYPNCNCPDCVSSCTCYGKDYNSCYSSCYGMATGGYAGYGGSFGGCSYPSCQCTDCVSQCSCNGWSPDCYGYCYGYGTGGYASSGGYPGYGGTTNVGGYGGYCNGVLCPSIPLPIGGISLPGCCAPNGTCGAVTDTIAGLISVQQGCQALSQPGYPDPQCPSSSSPAGALGGCCRPDGTCGNDLSVIGLGCVQHSSNGVITGCAPPGAGGSSSMDCYQNAQTDCERCACTTCPTSPTSCFADTGCTAILSCMIQTGCSGGGCYQPGTCQKIIDSFGGVASPSVSLAAPLMSCVAACNCGSPPPPPPLPL